MEDSTPLTSCRICGNTDLKMYLNLGKTPLANAILSEEDMERGGERYFPLEVMYCPKCHLSQLSVVVDPKIMFSNYPYRSSISMTLINHFKEIAEIFKKEIGFIEGDLVLDIASNDGSMLKQFKEKGFSVVGVDPAENLAKIANNEGIDTICAFWNKQVAEDIITKKGKAKIITATNVFAHVNDIRSFADAVRTMLDSEGVFMIEAPHAYQMIQHTEFDTIYHEHLSYLLVKPLKTLFESYSMRIFRVDETPIHGGSIRVFICHENSSHKETPSVSEVLEKERHADLHTMEGYDEFSKKVEKIKKDLKDLIASLKKDGKKIAAYGASAKGNTLLNYFGITPDDIRFISDDTPEKQNHYAPGTHIPILPSSEIEKESPDFLVLLAWNFARELMKKTEDFERRGGKYIIPIPDVTVATSKDYNKLYN